MKPPRTVGRSPAWLPSAAGLALFTTALSAAPFVYSPGDLILAVRQSNNPSDLVVNLGKAKDYSALTPGTSFVVTNLSTAQLAAAFPSVNELKWSIAGSSRPPGVDGFPLQTLWLTSPRNDPATASLAWLRKGQFVQGNVASQIDALGVNTAAYSSTQAAGGNNTVVGVVIPSTGNYALLPIIGDAGNFAGTFQGSAEGVTPVDFDADPNHVVRSDLYELVPGTTAAGTLDVSGRFLGYFELKPDGTLSFRAGTPAPAAPSILSVARVGTVTTVTFATTTGVSYRLRATGLAGLLSPVAAWTPGASTPGNGAVQSLQDTSSDEVRFFAVEAQ